jgi:RND family efflux transporter MFP subunit
MRANRRLLFVLTAAMSLVVVAAAIMFARRPAEVAVLTIEPQTTELALSLVGRVRPLDLVQVASPNSGQVVRLLRDDGDAVAAGEPLAVILSNVEQAQTAAVMARERAALAEAAEARQTFERARMLSDKGFAAPAALDSARAALQTAQARLAAAAADVRAASARAREFTIRAPMAGVVLVRPIDNGQVVAAGETLFELGSSAGIEIRGEVDEAYADTLKPGQSARAALSGSSVIFPARLTEVSPRIDPATGGRMVKLSPDTAQILSAGRSVDVTIVVDQRHDAIVLPRSSILDATASPKVYVVDQSGVVQLRSIAVARWPSANAIIERGLKAGDRVVLDPAATRAGAHVRSVAPQTRG